MFCNDCFTVHKRSLLKSFGILASSAALLLVCGCQTAGTATAKNSPETSAESITGLSAGHDRVREELGIEVIAIRTTAAGSMLDFRFKVLDKEKAMPFFLKELKPHLIDEKTGAVLEVPVPAKGGPMRPTSRDPREGITYFMLFANPGSFIKAGNQVAIVIGDIRVDNLVVE